MEKQFEEMYDRVFDLIDKGRTAEAMDIAQKLVDANMSNETAWFAYAYAKKEWGDSALAVKGFEQAIAINPEYVPGYIELAWCYGENEQSDVAIKYAQKALEISPTNVEAMDCVVRSLYDLEGIESAIAKCTEYIDMADEKIELQNLLGKLYVDKALLYVVDVPDDFQDPGGETTPGFVSLEDINDVRNYCNKAKSLLTLDRYKDDLEMADILLGACDNDQYQTMRISGWFFLISHAFITTVIYLLLSPFIIGIPCLLIAPWATFKANYMPLYMVNYAYYTGTGDPLAYKNERLANLQRAAADNGILEGDFGNILKAHIWVIRSRISYYKRFLKARKEKKQNKQLNAN